MNLQGILLLFNVFILSWVYKTYFINLISIYISIENQCMILMFISIIIQLDNISLYYDLNKKNEIYDENEHYIKIIGNQAIQLENDKIIIYNLTKFNEINFAPILNSPFDNQRRLRQTNSF
jgi:hypothetical protein